MRERTRNGKKTPGAPRDAIRLPSAGMTRFRFKGYALSQASRDADPGLVVTPLSRSKLGQELRDTGSDPTARSG